jgi:recombination protein RecT
MSKERQSLPAILDGVGKQEIARILGSEEKASRFARVSLTTIRKSEKLMKCDPHSIMAALLDCAEFDMEPDSRGLVHLVPYKSECQFLLGYRGMIELAHRSGMVQTIYADVVYKAEVEAGNFSYSGGTERHIRHDRDIMRPELRRGEIVAAYGVAKMNNGSTHIEVLDKEQIEKRRVASPGANSEYSPWKNWYEEMAKKTVIRVLCKTLPQSIERLHQAIATEDKYVVKAIEERWEAEQQARLTAQKLDDQIMGSEVASEDEGQEEAS